MRKTAPPTPLQRFQHLFSDALEQAAKELDEREKAALANYVHMRTSVELMPHLPRRAGGA